MICLSQQIPNFELTASDFDSSQTAIWNTYLAYWLHTLYHQLLFCWLFGFATIQETSGSFLGTIWSFARSVKALIPGIQTVIWSHMVTAMYSLQGSAALLQFKLLVVTVTIYDQCSRFTVQFTSKIWSLTRCRDYVGAE